MNNFKKELAANITLIVMLALSVLQLLLLILNLFGVINLNLREDFNYIVGFILVVVCLALFVLGFFVAYLKRIKFPQWLRICFYIAFFLFTNVYYQFGLYTNVFTIMLFMAYISFLVNIVSVSVFYNSQKDDNYRLKTSQKFITTSVFFYALGTNFIIETIITAAKAFLPLGLAVSINVTVIEFCSMLLVTIVMAIIFYLSLEKTKRLINGCLIKTINPNLVTRSVKDN